MAKYYHNDDNKNTKKSLQTRKYSKTSYTYIYKKNKKNVVDKI